jgi:hypothetical protein
MSTNRVPGSCVKLPRGSRSHNQRHCRKGETWRAGYDREVRATRKSLKAIEGGVQASVKSHRIARQCENSEVAAAINSCMSNFIESVREHMATKEHLGLETYPSESTLHMIQRKSQIGTQCVLRALSHCGGDKDQVRVLVDQYIQEQLNVNSMIPEMTKGIIEKRAEKINTLQDWVNTYRSGLGSSSSSSLGLKSLI